MPNIKSAKKRVKVSEKKNLENRMTRSALNTQIKTTKKTAESGAKPAVVAASLTDAYSKIDKAETKGVIHKNKANRMKSRTALSVNAQTETKTKKK